MSGRAEEPHGYGKPTHIRITHDDGPGCQAGAVFAVTGWNGNSPLFIDNDGDKNCAHPGRWEPAPVPVTAVQTIKVRVRVVVYESPRDPTGWSYYSPPCGEDVSTDAHMVWIEADVPVKPVTIAAKVMP